MSRTVFSRIFGGVAALALALLAASQATQAPAHALYPEVPSSHSVFVSGWGEPFALYLHNEDPRIGPPTARIFWRNGVALLALSAWAGTIAAANARLGLRLRSLGRPRQWFESAAATRSRHWQAWWRSLGLIFPLGLGLALLARQAEVFVFVATLGLAGWTVFVSVGAWVVARLTRRIDVAARPWRGAALGAAVGTGLLAGFFGAWLGVDAAMLVWAAIAAGVGALHGALVSVPGEASAGGGRLAPRRD